MPSDEIIEIMAREYAGAPFASKQAISRMKRALAAAETAGSVMVPAADYLRLFEASEADDTILHCDTCGAWMDHEDPARCTGEDFDGCWKVATGKGLCRHERGEVIEVCRRITREHRP